MVFFLVLRFYDPIIFAAAKIIISKKLRTKQFFYVILESLRNLY